MSGGGECEAVGGVAQTSSQEDDRQKQPADCFRRIDRPESQCGFRANTGVFDGPAGEPLASGEPQLLRIGYLSMIGLFALSGLANNLAAQQPSSEAAFAQEVLPLLREFCGGCHAKESSDGRWSFDDYERYTDLLSDQDTWGKARQLLANHLMPPQDEPNPSLDQRRRLLEWIDHAVFYVDPERPDPGRTTLRRLNRAEYHNSIRDVFALESRSSELFPADDSGYGFDNIADVLSLSPLHFEKYVAAAQEVAAEVIRWQSPGRVGVELTADKLQVLEGTPQLREKRLWLNSLQDEVGTVVFFPAASVYRILTRAAVAKDAAGNPLRFEVLCDGQPIAQLEPQAEWKGKTGPVSTAFALVEITAGEHRMALRLQPPAAASELPEALAAIDFLGISGPFVPMPPEASNYLREATGSRAMGTPILRLSGEDLDGGSGRNSLDTGRAWFASNGYRHAPLRLPASGEYRVRFKVGAQQVGDDPVKFEVHLGKLNLGPFAVTSGSQREQWLEIKCQLPAGDYDWQVWFINEYRDEQTGAERYFWLHEFSVEGPLEGEYGLSRDQTLQLLERTGRRLFRRPLKPQETEKLNQLVDQALATEPIWTTGLTTGLEALLISPKFLFHPQPQPLASDANSHTGASLIDEFTLASRLSTLIWSSVPDEELLALAERGELRTHFAAQVKRGLRDPKSRALTENFAGQWLRLRDMEKVAPDRQLFPEFDAQLAADMRRESELLFEHILRENRPAIEFLTADYSFMNARLAKLYHLPAPDGDDFTRVSLVDSPRRGVLTQASVLTLTSHPTRTSPVNRGKWILEQILGVEPPPAPADVPPLPETSEQESGSIRMRLEQHRANAACASCHALLDPPGFALENYDAIGRWRTNDAGHSLDTSGQLITGEPFRDWVELRNVIASERKEQFLRCLTEHLLTYALGRGLTYHDKPAVRKITSDPRSANIGFQDLILAVCESIPFQQMRSAPK